MTFLELILLMYDTTYALPYHPPSPETVICIDVLDTGMYVCEDGRTKYYNCTKEFGTLICPELMPV